MIKENHSKGTVLRKHFVKRLKFHFKKIEISLFAERKLILYSLKFHLSVIFTLGRLKIEMSIFSIDKNMTKSQWGLIFSHSLEQRDIRKAHFPSCLCNHVICRPIQCTYNVLFETYFTAAMPQTGIKTCFTCERADSHQDCNGAHVSKWNWYKV